LLATFGLLDDEAVAVALADALGSVVLLAWAAVLTAVTTGSSFAAWVIEVDVGLAGLELAAVASLSLNLAALTTKAKIPPTLTLARTPKAIFQRLALLGAPAFRCEATDCAESISCAPRPDVDCGAEAGASGTLICTPLALSMIPLAGVNVGAALSIALTLTAIFSK